MLRKLIRLFTSETNSKGRKITNTGRTLSFTDNFTQTKDLRQKPFTETRLHCKFNL